ncbi:aminoglycoside phosphotransferase family protein [Roseovarius sp. CAU 1744]|uniref:phosphotransferase family protein n=1 Tax=Roseovarius sp. CAU 1744 TaxID=3140368 RepID=UPI00325AD385
MLSLFNIDYLNVNKMIREFTSKAGLQGEISFVCIYRSANFEHERQVFKVSVGDKLFAMKVDRFGAKSGRLTSEFAVLQGLHQHFQKYDKQAIPAPVYLSESGEFFVVEFIDNRTATVAIKTAKNIKAAGQIYRRVGAWLHAFHQYGNITEARIYPNWMFEALDVSIQNGPHAPPEQYRPMITQLREEADQLKERRDTKVLCHGDFHASNVIMGQGVTYGFDFTEVTEKLALYDIVDFLKVDIFRTGVLSDVDRSGVTRQSKAMFFKLYRHPIDLDLLDFCLRGRLLKDWIFITSERHFKSDFQKNKFLRLEERLNIAFAQH